MQTNIDSVVEGFVTVLLQDLLTPTGVPQYSSVLLRLPNTKLFLFTRQLLQYLSRTYFDYTIARDGPLWWEADSLRIGAAISLLITLFSLNDSRNEKILATLNQIIENGSGLENLSIQRICTRLSTHSNLYPNSLVNNLISKWGDKAYINHTPISAQESPSPTISI